MLCRPPARLDHSEPRTTALIDLPCEGLVCAAGMSRENLCLCGSVTPVALLCHLARLQVSDLEEERRKLRLEVKFRAKYHGKAALEMGLSPEQLLLLEEYVEGLKGGRQPEERLVTQLQQRVRCLTGSIVL